MAFMFTIKVDLQLNSGAVAIVAVMVADGLATAMGATFVVRPSVNMVLIM